jgi:hypothetical protein
MSVQWEQYGHRMAWKILEEADREEAFAREIAACVIG